MTNEKIKLIVISGIVAFGTIITSYLTIQAYESYKMQKAMEYLNQQLEQMNNKSKAQITLTNERIKFETERRIKINEITRKRAKHRKTKQKYKENIEKNRQK